MFYLEPLDANQQLKIARSQLNKKNEFVANLLQFTQLRAEHDRTYTSLCSTETGRACAGKLQRVRCADQFKDASTGEWSAATRQRCVGGAHFVRRSEGAPQSSYLKRAHSVMEDLLPALDDVCGRLSANCTHKDAASVVADLPGVAAQVAGVPKFAAKIPERLVVIAKTYGQKPTELWPDIMARTDEMYHVLDVVTLDAFEQVVRQVVAGLACDVCSWRLRRKALSARTKRRATTTTGDSATTTMAR